MMMGSGGAILNAGCLSITSEQPGPIDFELLNFTEQTHLVDVLIRDTEGNIVLEEEYEISDRIPEQGANMIQEKGFVEATNTDTFDVIVYLSEEVSGGSTLQISCNKEDTRDVFYAEIRETSNGRDTYIEFQQSYCSSGQ